MNPLSITATGAAIANYQKAKSEVEKAKQDVAIENAALTIAINQYNETKYSGLEEYINKALDPETELPYDENNPISGVWFVPMLRLFTKYSYLRELFQDYADIIEQRPIIYVVNASDKEIKIHSISGRITCFGDLAAKLGNSIKTTNFILSPQSIQELNLSFGGDMEKLNYDFESKGYAWDISDMILHADNAHYKGSEATVILQSTPAPLAGYGDNGLCVMNLEVRYSDSKDKNVRRAYYRNIQGSIVFKGSILAFSGAAKAYDNPYE